MRTRWCITLLVVFALTLPAFGQTSPAEEKTANVRRLLALMGAEKLQAQILDQFMNIFKSSFANAAKPDERTQKILDRMTTLFTEEIKKADFMQMSSELYGKYFSNDEIKELIRFYESPTGRKLTEVLPTLSQESVRRGAELGQNAGKRAFERLAEEYPEFKALLNAPSK
jgi:uncharacterized protein